jgi:tetratricopeptide (TPR) repeat protein
VERNTLRVVDAYARFEAKRGNRDRAIEIYKTFDAMLPRHPVVRTALAQLEAGKPLAPLVTNAQEGAAEVLYGLGAAGSSSGDELPALIYLRLALHLEPDHPMALVTLADAYERLKQLDRAIEVFSRIPKDSPLRASADIAIGTNLEQLNRGAEAVAHLEALMKERPDDLEVIMAFGNVLRSRKEYARAAEVYTRAVDRIGTPDRGHWVLFFYRGTSYERAKQWDKAEADLKKALELVPDTLPNGQAQVLNYLAYSWVDMGSNIDEAFKMLQRAVELAPRDGMIIDSLGWAYYRLGRYEDAVRELERPSSSSPATRHQRPSRRRLLARRPAARGPLPVGPRQGLGPRARGASSRSSRRSTTASRTSRSPRGREHPRRQPARRTAEERRLTQVSRRHGRDEPGHPRLLSHFG